MNRGELREELKTLLVEPAAEEDNWNDAQLNRYLNSGLAHIESKILLVDPMAFVEVDSFGLIAGQDLYPVPAGAMTVLRLNQPKRLRFLQESVVAKENEDGATARLPLRYGRLGRYMRLAPKPTTTIADVMTITFVPTLTMAADADVPDIHENLQWLILLRAAIIATNGTSEKERLAGFLSQLSKGSDDIATYYRPQADGATYLRPDYDIIDGDDAFGFDAFGSIGPYETRA